MFLVKFGLVLVKVGILYVRWFEYFYLGLLFVVLCTEDKSMCLCCLVWFLVWSFENEIMEGFSRLGFDIWNDYF